MELKTPEEVVHDLFTTYAHIERTSDESITAESLYFLAARAVEADRTQRTAEARPEPARASFEALDQMLTAWEAYDGDAPGFIQAWADHIEHGDPLPRWARPATDNPDETRFAAAAGHALNEPRATRNDSACDRAAGRDREPTVKPDGPRAPDLSAFPQVQHRIEDGKNGSES